jgi:hypothetical protein
MLVGSKQEPKLENVKLEMMMPPDGPANSGKALGVY